MCRNYDIKRQLTFNLDINKSLRQYYRKVKKLLPTQPYSLISSFLTEEAGPEMFLESSAPARCR